MLKYQNLVFHRNRRTSFPDRNIVWTWAFPFNRSFNSSPLTLLCVVLSEFELVCCIRYSGKCSFVRSFDIFFLLYHFISLSPFSYSEIVYIVSKANAVGVIADIHFVVCAVSSLFFFYCFRHFFSEEYDSCGFMMIF